jgi:hypothetical protein
LEWPDAAPVSLKDALEGQIERWLGAFGSALPCPTPEFIKAGTKNKPGNVTTFLQWSFALQQQRAATKQALVRETGASAAEATGALKSLARGLRLLPLWSTHVHAICIYPTSLTALLNEAQAPLEARDGRKRKRGESPAPSSPSDIWEIFPGARRLLKGGRNGSLRLHPFIRTDGVTASVTCVRSAPLGEKTHKSDESQVATPLVDKGCQAPRDGQRLVAIDPGRRDMITMVSSDPAEARFKVSTREYRHNARISRTAKVSAKVLDFQDASLRAAMERLPCSRDFECWDEYLAAALPLVTARTEAMRIMCVRRARFASYMRRDQELDRICKRICGTSTKAERRAIEEKRKATQKTEPGALAMPTIVAFGAASEPSARASGARYACSTGFGYAPAPQGRLRQAPLARARRALRLAKVHGAQVTLIDEYRTSRTCSCCEAELEEVHMSKASAEKRAAERTAALRRRRLRRKRPTTTREAADAQHLLILDPSRSIPSRPVRTLIYGVLLCRTCKSRGGRPLFWHRDVNAARNILAVHLSLATTRKRPEAMTRPSDKTAKARAKTSLTHPRLGAPHDNPVVESDAHW